MNMMNKCAEFHKDSPSDKKVKFNLPSAMIELEGTADFVYNFGNHMQARNLGGAFDQFFIRIFMKISGKMPLNVFYTTVQKSKK